MYKVLTVHSVLQDALPSLQCDQAEVAGATAGAQGEEQRPMEDAVVLFPGCRGSGLGADVRTTKLGVPVLEEINSIQQ